MITFQNEEEARAWVAFRSAIEIARTDLVTCQRIALADEWLADYRDRQPKPVAPEGPYR